MHEIDLIPADYRLIVRFARLAKVAALGFVVAALALGAGYRSLKSASAREQRMIVALRAKQSATVQQGQELEELRAQQKRLERRLALLAAMRGGPTAESMLAIVDQALAIGGVWFTDWRFLRAGDEIDQRPEAVHTGYFVILPPDAEHPEAKAWRVETHMEIRGQARDHRDLSRFVKRLYDHPEIEDAKVLRTVTRPYGEDTVVDFDLAVVVAGSAARPLPGILP